MPHILSRLHEGHKQFKKEYTQGSHSFMRNLSQDGQKPEVMIIACSDSRVDPALLLQCQPGDLFVVRNVANIIPPYDNDKHCHGVSAAMEFGICFLGVKHLIIMGHSQCGGVQAMMEKESVENSDFIKDWVASAKPAEPLPTSLDICSQAAMQQSYLNSLSFPWIRERVDAGSLKVHRWFFNIADGSVLSYDEKTGSFAHFSGECADSDSL